MLDAGKARKLVVYPKEQKARLEHYAPAALYEHEVLRELQNVSSVESLASEELDGRKTPRFLATHVDGYIVTIWVDAESNLPVRVEAKGFDKGIMDRVTIFDDFVFDQEMDPDLFSLEPPVGYQVRSSSLAVQPVPSEPELRDPVVTPLVGIGPVKFGLSTAEVERLLGEPDNVKDEVYPATDLVYLSYHSRGILIKASKSVGVIEITCESHRDTTRGRSFSGKTDRDIALGASKLDVIRAHGDPSWINSSGTFLEYNRLGANFHFYDDRLTSMYFLDAQRASVLEPSATFSPDGRTLAVLHGKGPVRIWDVVTGKKIKEIDLALGPEKFPEHPAFTPDGYLTLLLCRYNRLATGPATPPTVSVCLWNLTTTKRSPFIEIGHGGVATSRKGEVLAYADGLWELAKGKKLCEVALPRGLVPEIVFPPDGRIVLYRLCDGTHDSALLFLADVTTGKEVLKIGEIKADNKGHRFVSPQFSPDGKQLAFSEWGRQPALHIWDIARAKAVNHIDTDLNWETALGFSPDSQTLASWDAGGYVRLWETATGKEHHSVDVGRGLDKVVLSPDGKTAALLKGKAVEFRSLREQAGQEP